jgi:hypothetical protein
VFEDLVNEAKVFGLFRGHEPVPVEGRLYLLDISSRVLRIEEVDPVLEEQDFLGMDMNVRSLALRRTQGLMNHDPRVGE